MKRLITLALLLGTAALSGCATVSPPLHDPEYAPAEPMSMQPPVQNNGAIYQAGFGMRLFEDQRARRVGDMLLVLLTENTSASKTATTSTTKDQDFDIGIPTVLGKSRDWVESNASAGRDFEGEGESSQSNQISGEITVTVARVYPNGNMLVKGEKVMTINQGDEFVRFAGIVRQADVTPENTVLSTRVANAKITYGGKGAIADSNSQGWLARFFNSPVFPF